LLPPRKRALHTCAAPAYLNARLLAYLFLSHPLCDGRCCARTRCSTRRCYVCGTPPAPPRCRFFTTTAYRCCACPHTTLPRLHYPYHCTHYHFTGLLPQVSYCWTSRHCLHMACLLASPTFHTSPSGALVRLWYTHATACSRCATQHSFCLGLFCCGGAHQAWLWTQEGLGCARARHLYPPHTLPTPPARPLPRLTHLILPHCFAPLGSLLPLKVYLTTSSCIPPPPLRAGRHKVHPHTHAASHGAHSAPATRAWLLPTCTLTTGLRT